MAEATITEVSISDLPAVLNYGTSPKRRALVQVRATTGNAMTNTVTLATYCPGIADIEGVAWETAANAVVAAGSTTTWSTTTATLKYANTDFEVGFIVNYT